MLSDGTRVIAVCMADNCTDHCKDYADALCEVSRQFPIKLLFFSCFSSLYSLQKHDLGESTIFNLINYDLTDGIIILSESIKSDEIRYPLAKKALSKGIPVVCIEHPIKGCYNITYEYKDTYRKLLDHLIEDHGYKRINFISGIEDNNFSDLRLEVYKEALADHGLPFEPDRVGYGQFWGKPTRKVIQNFLKSNLPFPEAIACANDSMAIAAINELNLHGYQVPEDIAVIGYDGIDEAIQHMPPITTVRYDFVKTSIDAINILMDCFENKLPEVESHISTNIVYGHSCGCEVSEKTELGAINALIHKLYDSITLDYQFNEIQIALAADLTDNDHFHGVFSNLQKYADNFQSENFWLCITDDFLNEQEELSDIIANTNIIRHGYSSRMDLMLSKIDGQWQGMIDFNTKELLPNLEELLMKNNNLTFLPLHMLEKNIGYVVIVYEPSIKMPYLYQFVMNISNALETTKTNQRQRNIITSLENKYIHDPMTGLYNRRGFFDRVRPLYAECIESGKPIMIVSADLNRLKYINDTFGHQDGDLAINTVASALQHSMPSNSTCARFGGDEFVAACIPDSDEEENVFRKNISGFLDEFNFISGKEYQVSTSLGIVCTIPNENISLEDLIKHTDELMYVDKVKHHQNRTN